MRVIVVGAGGVIGSHFVPHFARLRAVDNVVLIDRDCYEADNLRSQDISPADVGRQKAEVQAERLRARRPELQIVALASNIESVPRWALHGDLLVTCLDSRRARQVASEIAIELGMPLLDAGVEATNCLARVSTYPAVEKRVCLECAWGDSGYAALDQEFSCGAVARAFPTGASSSLGALAAARLAIECERMFSHSATRAREIVLDAAYDRMFVTELKRNSNCRLPNHEHVLDGIEPLGATVSLRTLLKHTGSDAALPDGPSLRVHGMRFRANGCLQCGGLVCPRLNDQPRVRPGPCGTCGGVVESHTELHISELLARQVAPVDLEISLADLGIRHDDLLSVTGSAGIRHYHVRVESAP